MPINYRIKNNRSAIGTKLSRRILLFSLPITIAFVLIAIIFSFNRLYNFQETTNNKNLYLRHEFTVDYLTQWAVEGHMVLEDIALRENLQNQYDIPINEENASSISEQLLLLADTYAMTNRKYYDQVMVINKDGQVLASSDENLLFTSINREYFYVNYARQGLDGVYFIEDPTSMFPQQSIVQIYPLFTNIGNPNGAVVGIGNISHLSDTIRTTERIFPESELFIVSEDQNYYTYSPENNSFSIETLNDSQLDIYQSLFSKQSENDGIVYTQNTNFNNQEAQTVFTWDSDLNLGIGTSYAPEEITQQYYFILAAYILVFIVVIILFIFIVNIFVNNSLSPISQIITANQQLSIGDWNFKLPSLQNKEFTELTSSYIKFLDRLIRMGFLPNTVELNELANNQEDLSILEELITASEEDLLSELDIIEKSVDEFSEKTAEYENSIKNLSNELLIYKNILSEINSNKIFSKIKNVLFEKYKIEKFEFYSFNDLNKSTQLMNQSSNSENAIVFEQDFDHILWTINNKVARKREVLVNNSNIKYSEFIVPISNQELSYGAFAFYSSDSNVFTEDFMKLLNELGENIGKIYKLSDIFEQMKNSLNDSPTKQSLETIDEVYEDSEKIDEEIRVKYFDLDKTQQEKIDIMLNELKSIYDIDTFMQSIVKNISDLPYVSETIIQTFDIENEKED